MSQGLGVVAAEKNVTEKKLKIFEKFTNFIILSSMTHSVMQEWTSQNTLEKITAK